jgi:hypothetical protein
MNHLIPGAGAVTILGNPYTVVAILPTVLLTCGCPAKTLIVLQGMGAQGMCPACTRGFALQGVQLDAQGTGGATIASGLARRAD